LAFLNQVRSFKNFGIVPQQFDNLEVLYKYIWNEYIFWEPWRVKTAVGLGTITLNLACFQPPKIRRFMGKVTLSSPCLLGLLSPPTIPSSRDIWKVRKIY
jgi:hypothetical protein